MSTINQIWFRFLDSLFRYKWLFLASLFGVIAVSMVALKVRGKTFYGSAAIEVMPQETASAVGLIQAAAGWTSPAEKNAQRLRDFLTDNTRGGFLDVVFHDAQLSKPINLDPAANDKRFQAFRKGVSANAMSEDIFTIDLTWPDYGECQRILKSLQQHYVTEVGQREEHKSTATEQFLDSEIKDYEKRLQVAEQALTDYKSQNMGALPEQQTAMVQQLNDLREKLNDLQITARDNQLRQQALKTRLARIQPMSIKEQTFGGDPNASPAQDPLTAQVRDLQIQRAMLLNKGYTPEHPAVKTLDGQIATLRQAIAQNKTVKQTTLQQNPEYQDLTQKLTQAQIDETTQQSQMQLLQQQIAQYQAHIARLPQEDRELTQKTRDYTVLKTQYEDLLTRREQARLKASLDRTSAESGLQPVGIVDVQAQFGAKKMAITLAGSAIFGFVLGLALVILREWLDHSLRYASDAQRILHLPVLATVPESTHLQSASVFPALDDGRPSPNGLSGPGMVAAAALAAGRSGNGRAATGSSANGSTPSGAHRTLVATEQYGSPFIRPEENLDAADRHAGYHSNGTDFSEEPESLSPVSLPQFTELYSALERHTPVMTEGEIGSVLLDAEGTFVIGVTSAIAGEGKTTVAANLAMNAARLSYKKVCLIDLGGGSGDLAAQFGMKSERKGPVSIISLDARGEFNPELQISEFEFEQMMDVPNRSTPLDQARLARSPRLIELIATAREMFGLIIVDLPAVATHNVLPLMKHLDGVVMVACAGATPKEMVEEAIDEIGRDRVLGVVLNRVKSSSPDWLLRRFAKR